MIFLVDVVYLVFCIFFVVSFDMLEGLLKQQI